MGALFLNVNCNKSEAKLASYLDQPILSLFNNLNCNNARSNASTLEDRLWDRLGIVDNSERRPRLGATRRDARPSVLLVVTPSLPDYGARRGRTALDRATQLRTGIISAYNIDNLKPRLYGLEDVESKKGAKWDHIRLGSGPGENRVRRRSRVLHPVFPPGPDPIRHPAPTDMVQKSN